MTQLTQIQQAKQLNENDRVIAKGLVTASAVRETANGKAYADFTISDKTGSIGVKKWGTSTAPELNTVVEVEGKINVWQDTKSINAASIAITNDPPGAYVESSHVEPEVLFDRVRLMIEAKCTKPVSDLINDILRGFKTQLLDSPAAKNNHHARRGGLLEHTDSMIRLASQLHQHYDNIYGQTFDLGLLIAGIALHDIGKVAELSGSQGTEYTTTGKLVGHIPHGILMLEEGIQKVKEAGETLPSPEIIDQLRHMILSHHGQLAWGSPVVPQTPEAIILHQLDMMDSRMDAVATAIRKSAPDAEWSDYNKALGTSVYLGGK